MSRRFTVWGGATYPELRFVPDSGVERRYVTSDRESLPQVYLTISWEEAQRELNRLADGTLRRRLAGFILRFELRLSRPSNAALIEFLIQAQQTSGQLYIRPRPNRLYWPPTYPHSDEWRVEIEKFDWGYFRDRWVGHEVKVALVSCDLLPGLPVYWPGADFVPVEYESDGVTPTDETGYTFYDERMFAGDRDPQTGTDTGVREVAYYES